MFLVFVYYNFKYHQLMTNNKYAHIFSKRNHKINFYIVAFYPNNLYLFIFIFSLIHDPNL